MCSTRVPGVPGLVLMVVMVVVVVVVEAVMVMMVANISEHLQGVGMSGNSFRAHRNLGGRQNCLILRTRTLKQREKVTSSKSRICKLWSWDIPGHPAPEPSLVITTLPLEAFYT